MNKELIGIVAIEVGFGIGLKNGLPWHIKADLQHFKGATLGHTLVMGRNTFESIGSFLIGRSTIVLSRSPIENLPEGVLNTHTLEEAIEIAQTDKIFICGGAQVYKQAMPYIKRWLITRIKASIACDTFLTGFNADEWLSISSKEIKAGVLTPYDLEITEYIRI